jgi:hypothetical protein
VDKKFQIAPGDPAYPVKAIRTLDRDFVGVGLFTHMHLRGKAMTMEAILPNGQTQVLSHVADFNFNWHNSYVYKETASPLLPKGTIIKVTAWHDNTAANKANPDPNVWVGYGDRTVDEMAHAWVNVTYMNDADYRAAIEERRKAVAATATAPQEKQ